jgi:hypothetical protein
MRKWGFVFVSVYVLVFFAVFRLPFINDCLKKNHEVKPSFLKIGICKKFTTKNSKNKFDALHCMHFTVLDIKLPLAL